MEDETASMILSQTILETRVETDQECVHDPRVYSRAYLPRFPKCQPQFYYHSGEDNGTIQHSKLPNISNEPNKYQAPPETAWIRRVGDLSGEGILTGYAADSRRRKPVGRSRHAPNFQAIAEACYEPVISRVGSTFNFVSMFELVRHGHSEVQSGAHG